MNFLHGLALEILMVFIGIAALRSTTSRDRFIRAGAIAAIATFPVALIGNIHGLSLYVERCDIALIGIAAILFITGVWRGERTNP